MRWAGLIGSIALVTVAAMELQARDDRQSMWGMTGMMGPRMMMPGGMMMPGMMPMMTTRDREPEMPGTPMTGETMRQMMEWCHQMMATSIQDPGALPSDTESAPSDAEPER